MNEGGYTPVMTETDRAAARDLSLRGVRPPAKVPGYEQEQFLGHGAYGEVWVAVNRNSGRKVADQVSTPAAAASTGPASPARWRSFAISSPIATSCNSSRSAGNPIRRTT